MSDTESYFYEISESFISESDKLQAEIDHLLQKSKNFSINEIVSIYYQIMNITSLIHFLKQNISNNNSEKTKTLLEKIKLSENLIGTTFNTNLHSIFLSHLIDNIQEIMTNLKSNEGKEKTKEIIESEAKLYEKLRATMSTKEFVEQYDKGLSND
jgi:hypothetical protein